MSRSAETLRFVVVVVVVGRVRERVQVVVVVVGGCGCGWSWSGRSSLFEGCAQWRTLRASATAAKCRV